MRILSVPACKDRCAECDAQFPLYLLDQYIPEVQVLTHTLSHIGVSACRVFFHDSGEPQGLRKIRETGESIGVPIRVYGPETHITAVVPMALGLVDGATVPEFDQVPEQVR